MSKLELARQLAEAGELDDSFAILSKLLEETPNNSSLLILASYIQWKAKRLPMAYHLAKRATDLSPAEPAAWINLGTACDELWLVEEAEQAYRMVLRLGATPAQKSMAYANLSALFINTGRFSEAEPMAKEALKLNPTSPKAEANLGFAMLGQRNWNGWKHYSRALGLTNRIKVKFGDEPDWDGSKDKVVALYGEQGVGDEISFASMVPDAIKDCKKVVLETEPKLKGLFQRSFPKAKVYGTRRQKEGLAWDEEDRKMDASCALGELGGFYRTTDESFTGEPYLVADPERRLMWRALFDSKKKPVIGIAWTGGVPWTAQKYRTLTLDQLTFLKSIDAHWVCLQYKDASAEIAAYKAKNPEVDLVQYPFATLTPDYDDTAALVAEVDMVVSVQTAVCHLAGALGKDCFVLLPKTSQWRYGETGDRMPWYRSVSVFRQRSLNDWHGPIGEVTGRLRKRYALQEAA
jgi:hypothetical protein